MKLSLINLKFPALIASVLILPFMLLEWVNRQNFNEGFPFVLFSLMWILPTAFFAILFPLVRSARAGENLMARPIRLAVKILALGLLAWLWTMLLFDQMPCFLGVPNCD